jgi:hypothetical protein
VLSLVPPASDRAAVQVVRAFFDAITRENLELLATLLTPDATVPSPSHGPASALIDHWRARMNHLPYQTLANEALYDESRVEAYRFHDWDAGLSGRPARPADMLASDILVRVPMQLVRSGSERLFADEVVFLLRKHKDALAIAEQIEDFPLQ